MWSKPDTTTDKKKFNQFLSKLLISTCDVFIEIGVFSLSLSAHAVIRKWILLSDLEDKMAGAKVINLFY